MTRNVAAPRSRCFHSGIEIIVPPCNQRLALWNLYNGRIGKGESIRAFPLSNGTEQDVWAYIAREAIPIVPLYFAKPRPVVWRDGT